MLKVVNLNRLEQEFSNHKHLYALLKIQLLFFHEVVLKIETL